MRTKKGGAGGEPSSISVSASSQTKANEKAAMKQMHVDMIDLRCLLIAIAMLERVNGVRSSPRSLFLPNLKNLKTYLEFLEIDVRIEFDASRSPHDTYSPLYQAKDEPCNIERESDDGVGVVLFDC